MKAPKKLDSIHLSVRASRRLALELACASSAMFVRDRGGDIVRMAEAFHNWLYAGVVPEAPADEAPKVEKKRK